MLAILQQSKRVYAVISSCSRISKNGKCDVSVFTPHYRFKHELSAYAYIVASNSAVPTSAEKELLTRVRSFFERNPGYVYQAFETTNVNPAVAEKASHAPEQEAA